MTRAFQASAKPTRSDHLLQMFQRLCSTKKKNGWGRAKEGVQGRRRDQERIDQLRRRSDHAQIAVE